jgi:hypothetical protein
MNNSNYFIIGLSIISIFLLTVGLIIWYIGLAISTGIAVSVYLLFLWGKRVEEGEEIRACKKLIKKYPKSVDAYILLGLTLDRKGKSK